MSQLRQKPPVVTIMGHVDHGKTTLLDKIRHTNVTASEAGGITQHIGAYQIDYKGQPITFIDTPGHAAFAKMRAHGAQLTDIIVLVVAADDGVKPQTIEAVKLIQATKVPSIVAINKMDVKGATPDMVKAQLVEHELAVEGYGGSIPVVEISAREGKNIDKLLETISVLAEMEELKADVDGPLQAAVIESSHHKNQGPMASVLVTQGTLKPGMDLASVNIAESVTGKVKRMTNDKGISLEAALPATPVSVLGLKSVPPIGTVFTTPDQVATLTEKLTQLQAEAKVDPDAIKDDQKVKIILRADTLGSLEAITQNLPAEVILIDARVGEVIESDILLAQTTKALIISFQSKVNRNAARLAEVEGVRIKHYDVIYQLLEDFEQVVLKLLEPTIDETELGQGKVKATFNMKGSLVIGCAVTSGALKLNNRVHVKRGENTIGDATIVSLKQGKVDIGEAAANTECGLVLKPQLGVEVDDVLVAFSKAK